MRGYHIIGDVHGCAALLEDRLIGLGYRRRGRTGAYIHPDYHAMFVGDLIDRGPQQLETLEMVKAMVDVGSASVVMGNHEFNAVAYATKHPSRPGEFLRPHTEKNDIQHQAFLDQLTPSQQKYYVGWFKTLPLWRTLKLNGGRARVVHACWHKPSMRVVRAACGGKRLSTGQQWTLATDRSSDLYQAVEILLKGPELALESYGLPGFTDKDGHARDHARINWWRQGERTLGGLTEKIGGIDPDIEVDGHDLAYVYSGTVPVFFGHHWRKDKPDHSVDFTDHTACVDFSAVNNDAGGGTLVAYRWQGESTIKHAHYIPHGAAHRESV